MTETDQLSVRRLRAWLRLLRLVRGTEKHLREFLRVNFDTTLPRFDVAAALFRQDGPIKMSDLSTMLLVSNGNTTNVVERLEHEGKVRRIAGKDDRRVVFVELSEKGRQWFGEIAEEHEREVNRMFSELDEEHLNQLRNLIKIAERAVNEKHG